VLKSRCCTWAKPQQPFAALLDDANAVRSSGNSSESLRLPSALHVADQQISRSDENDRVHDFIIITAAAAGRQSRCRLETWLTFLSQGKRFADVS
jgi:hypothetical protein